MFCYTFPFPSTDEYKTKKLVLRKIPAGDYWIGEKNNTATIVGGPNSWHKTNMAKDYYIGIFKLSVAQYDRIASNSKTSDMKPKFYLSFNDLRGTTSSVAVPSTASIIGKLNTNLKSNGNDIGDGFDLPTTSMWEAAARAGCETRFLWGDTTSGYEPYTWCRENSAADFYQPVGTAKLPNAWGIYDVHGSGYELSRDTWNNADLATLQPNGETPINSGANYNEVCLHGGPGTNSSIGNNEMYRLSARYPGWTKNSANERVTQRLAIIRIW